MKTFFAMLTIFTTASLLACPDLAGKYSCENDGVQEVITVTQSGNTYQIIDSEGTQTIIADGEPRIIDQGLTQIAKCNGDSINLIMTGSFDGNEFNAVVATKKENGNLVSESQVTFGGMTESETQVCTSL